MVHEGESIVPKAMTGKGGDVINNFGGVTINLKSSGSSQMDARNIADAVIREMNRRLKMEARRL